MPNAGTPPKDLITAKEASVMAGKSVATIRSWVRKGKLTPYKEDENNHSSPLLISTTELKAYLHIGATITHPNNNGRPPSLSVSLQERDKHIQALENELELVKREQSSHLERIQDLQAFISTLKELLQQRERESKALKDELEASRLRAESKQNEITTLLKWANLPFWKRWKSAQKLLNG